jgi:Transposase domain (DUF772)
MMGRLAGQAQFFYAFHLNEVAPADHVVRRIDAVLDLGWIHKELAPFYSCGLSIEDKIPDHSVFSRARHERFRESEVFRRVFERVVASCIAVGLVGGEAFSIDASLIKADVDHRKRMSG